jgi:predicted DNA-binding transcriptional regulator YafY
LPESFADVELELGLEPELKPKLKPPPLEMTDAEPSSLVHLVLRFAPYAAYRVYDEFDTEDVTKNADGSLTVKKELPEDDWLYGFLLSFGTAVTIIEPKSVAKNLLLQIDEIKSFLEGRK